MTRVRVVWRLMGAFSRAGRVWRSALPAGIAALLLMTVFVALQSFTLSSGQRTERDLGGYEATMSVGTLSAGNAEALESAARRAGATVATVVVFSPDVTLADPGGPRLGYFEAAGSEEYPVPVRLLEGRWPGKPGEVAVTAGVMEYVDGGKLGILNGFRQLTVVGTIEQQYATSAISVVAARGTWDSLSWAELPGFMPPALGGQLWWSGAPPSAVVDEVAPLLAPDSFEMYGDLEDSSARAGLVANGTVTRDASLSRPALGAVELYPLAFTVPSLVIPALGALLGLGANSRRARRNMATLRAVGLTARDATIGVVGAGCVAVLLATVAGLLLGAAGGLAVRPVLAELASQPLGPADGLVDAAARILGATAVALAAGVVLGVTRARLAPLGIVAAALPLVGKMPFARQAAFVVLVVALVWQSAAMSQLFDAVPLVVVIMLLALLTAPELVRGIITRLPTRRSHGLLATRRLLAEPTRTILGVSLTALTVGPAVAMAVLVQSAVIESSAMAGPLVAPGQILVSTGDSTVPPPPEVGDLVARSVGSSPVTIWNVGDADLMVTAGPSRLGWVAAVDTPQDLARVCGTDLTEENVDLLAAGGAIDLQDPTAHRQQPLWTSVPGALTADDLGNLTVGGTLCAEAWQRSGALVVLTDTVHRLGLPTIPSQLLFTDVPLDTARQALDAVAAAGWDPHYLEVYDGPGAVPVPPEVIIALIAVVVFGAVLVGFTTWSRISTVERHDRSLRVLGLPSVWLRRVLHRESATITATGLSIALVIALVPVALTSLRLPEATIVIPWAGVLGLIAIPMALSALVTTVASHRLTGRAHRRGVRSGPRGRRGHRERHDAGRVHPHRQ